MRRPPKTGSQVIVQGPEAPAKPAMKNVPGPGRKAGDLGNSLSVREFQVFEILKNCGVKLTGDQIARRIGVGSARELVQRLARKLADHPRFRVESYNGRNGGYLLVTLSPASQPNTASVSLSPSDDDSSAHNPRPPAYPQVSQ